MVDMKTFLKNLIFCYGLSTENLGKSVLLELLQWNIVIKILIIKKKLFKKFSVLIFYPVWGYKWRWDKVLLLLMDKISNGRELVLRIQNN